jgi:endonuclease/exonuclease/phosphatase family metal-dependent hydrolase
MRIMTYNIHGWRTMDSRSNLAAVGDAILASGADVVGLNEVHYPRLVEGDARPALQALAARLGMHFVFGPCLRWPAKDDMPADAYGNALLSRWPIIASAAHHLTPKEEDQQGLLAAREQRGLLEGRILLPDGQTFTAYVTHLDHTDEEARAVQLRVARTWLGRDRNRPHALMGDFNALSPWDMEGREVAADALRAHPSGHNLLGGAKGLQVIPQVEKAGYVDLYRKFGEPGARTYLPAAAAIRIDYIFASQALAERVTGCWIETAADGVSDHRPVMAEIL